MSKFVVLDENEAMKVDGGYTRYRDRSNAISPERANREGRAMIAAFAGAIVTVISGGTAGATVASGYVLGGAQYLLDK